MCKSPFPYGDCHMETGSCFIVLPIWKRGFPYGNGDFQFAIWKRGAVSFSSIWKRGFPYGNGDSRFLYGDPHFHVLIPLWKFNYNYARNEHVNCFLLYKFLLLCWKTHPPTPMSSLTILRVYFCNSCYSCGNASCIAYPLSCMNSHYLLCSFPCSCSV